MKTTFSLLTLALAAAFAAPAMADEDDADINSYTTLHNHIAVVGGVRVQGQIDIDGESAATVDQDQVTGGHRSVGDGDHTARVGDGAMNRASGNIGVNVSAGVGNAQANDAAISSLTDDGPARSDKGRPDQPSRNSGPMATAMVFSTQGTAGNSASSREWGTNYRATLGDDALRNASGNIGLNIAAGVGNGQSNALAVAVADDARLVKAGADSEQVTLLNYLDSSCGDLDLVASVGGALQNASGNIGVNVASGVGNLQHNGLSIASASCAACGD